MMGRLPGVKQIPPLQAYLNAQYEHTRVYTQCTHEHKNNKALQRNAGEYFQPQEKKDFASNTQISPDFLL